MDNFINCYLPYIVNLELFERQMQEAKILVISKVKILFDVSSEGQKFRRQKLVEDMYLFLTKGIRSKLINSVLLPR